jgi:hypothetical protein
MTLIHVAVSRRVLRTAIVALAILVSACTHAPKNQAEQARADPGKATVYVYRASDPLGASQPFYVSLDGKPVSPLLNASYILLNLEPGQHRLVVSPGPFGYNRGADIAVVAGEQRFYQFEFEPGDDNRHFGNTMLNARDEIAANSTMAGLRRTVDRFNDRRLTYPATRFASVGDVTAVPAINERGREVYRNWLKQRHPRAFVVASNGAFFSVWGMAVTDIPGLSDPTTRAMQRCARLRGVVCQVYAINNSVVWQPLPVEVVQRERQRKAAASQAAALAVQGEDEAAVQAPQ